MSDPPQISRRLGKGRIVRARVTEENGIWSFNWLHVPPADRGNGHGAWAMGEVLKQADAAGIAVRLEARACGGMDQEALVAWYESLGFVLTGQISKLGSEMLREARPNGHDVPTS